MMKANDIASTSNVIHMHHITSLTAEIFHRQHYNINKTNITFFRYKLSNEAIDVCHVTELTGTTRSVDRKLLMKVLMKPSVEILLCSTSEQFTNNYSVSYFILTNDLWYIFYWRYRSFKECVTWYHDNMYCDNLLLLWQHLVSMLH